MSPGRLTGWAIVMVLIVLLAGVGGWSLGSGSADGKSDAASAREDGYSAGFDLVYGKAFRLTTDRGLKAGASRGRLAGRKTGSREGLAIGAGNAEIEEAVDSQKSAESAASYAQSEIAARQPNCGILAAAPSWCPTSAELNSYRRAVRAAREANSKAAKKTAQNQPGQQ